MMFTAVVPEGWSTSVYRKHGVPMARLLRNGSEVHFEVAEGLQDQVIFKNAARDFLRPVFEEHGFLTTRTLRGDVEAGSFVTRFGFQPTWSDNNFDYYMLTELPFGKKGK